MTDIKAETKMHGDKKDKEAETTKDKTMRQKEGQRRLK